MSEVPTQSEDRAALGGFLELRDSLRERRIGEGGRQVCLALSAALDDALQQITKDLDPETYALVAVGGYGRSELSLFSDVDLMILHDSPDPAFLASHVFRPLWDSNLRVGHSVRTVEEAASAAKESFETHTTLITSRRVAGNRQLFERLRSHVLSVTKARPLQRYLVEEERERRRKSPYLAMSVDVKNGRGGLRTLQSFAWVHAREKLIGRFSPPSNPDEEEAYETLITVRNALHAAAGRRYDVFSHDLRDPAARWLGVEPIDVATRLMEAVETADRIASHRWPEVVEIDRSTTARALRLFRRPGVNRTDTAPTAEDLALILRSGEGGRAMFDELHSNGHLDNLIPEWETVRALPQLAPFHDHPVDAHLWRTVDEMERLIHGEDDHYAGIAAEVGSPLALTLAAFLHDIGKGRGGDHSEIGEEIARSVCARLECTEEVTELVGSAVRHHLLLAETATRRDIEDPAVIDQVVDAVGSLRDLQLLYLLTVADSMATGPTMWSEWKATLLRTLFVRVAGRFGAASPRNDLGRLREEALSLVDTKRREIVTAHIDAMPSDYLTESSAFEVIRHAELADRVHEGPQFETEPGDVADFVRVVMQGDLRSRQVVAEAFAAHGADVLQARLRTRADGVLVDSFIVHDDMTGGPLAPEKWKRIAEDARAALAGDLDTTGKVEARAHAYASANPSHVLPRVEISHDEATGDPVITIRCSDRVGRLAQILTALIDSGAEIRLAKLDSRGGELLDTFHVRPESLPSDDRTRRDLESRILDAL